MPLEVRGELGFDVANVHIARLGAFALRFVIFPAQVLLDEVFLVGDAASAEEAVEDAETVAQTLFGVLQHARLDWNLGVVVVLAYFLRPALLGLGELRQFARSLDRCKLGFSGVAGCWCAFFFIL